MPSTAAEDSVLGYNGGAVPFGADTPIRKKTLFLQFFENFTQKNP